MRQDVLLTWDGGQAEIEVHCNQLLKKKIIKM